ncbi:MULTISPECIES: MerR family transcriptional regulator [unclassified Streptomyces]|uniref:MerR family transcriptional regulator n=1 Tax=unclassified Streptomyces TaxID=2593676 RepID=UPI00116469B7|nr:MULTISPECIES: MerR family transcriptional regulator [unclassified Streptomyces]NMI62496.1 MerR family transcriptional regulator [Streptomyces sp. RLA2-12]QDN61493.1 MerR family transcriptional regulator [Streptomyces sp. S1D4-20]QDN71546.1 MerR family transcriptional regulator [Streptomyces sp. S1D4-14]QDO54002.1 MerR family transcriptional regulator [Streptomyces sp. RLB3-5]QDO64247.1 MerR family transcriptional regulator [Streptomyces sp. RLB1-8]
MTTDTEEPTLTVDELAARAGVTVRTVRFYSSKGLLPPPVIGPRRVGHYSQEHLARLALIEELQRQGMTLAAIERHLQQLPADLSAQDLALHRAVVASWAPDAAEDATREELERRAGRPLGEEDLERLVAMNIIERAEGASGTAHSSGSPAALDSSGSPAAPNTFRVDPALLALGVQLLDVPLAHESILAARGVLLEHSRAAARELSALLREAVGEHESVAAVKSLSAHMQPLVVQALLTTFQRSLKAELREWLKES